MPQQDQPGPTAGKARFSERLYEFIMRMIFDEPDPEGGVQANALLLTLVLLVIAALFGCVFFLAKG